jgi:hypothetical protein
VLRVWLLAGLALVSSPIFGQDSTETSSGSLVETGQVIRDGRPAHYRIQNLPVSSFPQLPAAVAAALESRKCLIPQTYQAHRPENVIHASLERAGSEDWAVLCSANGRVSLLVFLASGRQNEPMELTSVAVSSRLQARNSNDSNAELGFDWGIDPASPGRVHDAQAGMKHRPPVLDHDCLADTVIDQRTVYHLYRNWVWETVDVE